jgi:hypothetical protein
VVLFEARTTPSAEATAETLELMLEQAVTEIGRRGSGSGVLAGRRRRRTCPSATPTSTTSRRAGDRLEARPARPTPTPTSGGRRGGARAGRRHDDRASPTWARTASTSMFSLAAEQETLSLVRRTAAAAGLLLSACWR